MSDPILLQIWGNIYGGLSKTSDPNVTLPFVVRKDTVEISSTGEVVRIVEPAVERANPQCAHFGTCGGCQYQMVDTRYQPDIKRDVLWHALKVHGVTFPVEIPAHSAQGYGYRNRIRLRVESVDGEPRLGYNVRGTTEFLPVVMCPIAAPVLWATAEALRAAAKVDEDAGFWMKATSEVELFCNDDLSRLQVTLLCAPRTKVKQGSLARCFAAMQESAPVLAGLAAIASDERTGPTGRTLDAVGSAGLNYRVG